MRLHDVCFRLFKNRDAINIDILSFGNSLLTFRKVKIELRQQNYVYGKIEVVY